MIDDWGETDFKVMYADTVYTRLAHILNVYIDLEYYAFYPYNDRWDLTPFLGAGYDHERFGLPQLFEASFTVHMFRMFEPRGSSSWRAQNIPTESAELIELMDILSDNGEGDGNDID